jgi:hypothetical protein
VAGTPTAARSPYPIEPLLLPTARPWKQPGSHRRRMSSSSQARGGGSGGGGGDGRHRAELASEAGKGPQQLASAVRVGGRSSHPPPPDVVVVAGQRRPDLEVAEMEGVGRSSHPKPGRDHSSSHPPSGWAAAARIHRRRHRSSKWCSAGAARRSSRGCSPGCSSSSSAVVTDSSPRI